MYGEQAAAGGKALQQGCMAGSAAAGPELRWVQTGALVAVELAGELAYSSQAHAAYMMGLDGTSAGGWLCAATPAFSLFLAGVEHLWLLEHAVVLVM
jgi:hypothetical protein